MRVSRCLPRLATSSTVRPVEVGGRVAAGPESRCAPAGRPRQRLIQPPPRQPDGVAFGHVSIVPRQRDRRRRHARSAAQAQPPRRRAGSRPPRAQSRRVVTEDVLAVSPLHREPAERPAPAAAFASPARPRQRLPGHRSRSAATCRRARRTCTSSPSTSTTSAPALRPGPVAAGSSPRSGQGKCGAVRVGRIGRGEHERRLARPGCRVALLPARRHRRGPGRLLGRRARLGGEGAHPVDGTRDGELRRAEALDEVAAAAAAGVLERRQHRVDRREPPGDLLGRDRAAGEHAVAVQQRFGDGVQPPGRGRLAIGQPPPAARQPSAGRRGSAARAGRSGRTASAGGAAATAARRPRAGLARRAAPATARACRW